MNNSFIPLLYFTQESASQENNSLAIFTSLTSLLTILGKVRESVWEEEPNNSLVPFVGANQALGFPSCLYCTLQAGVNLKRANQSTIRKGNRVLVAPKIRYHIWLQQEVFWEGSQVKQPWCPNAVPQKERAAANALSVSSQKDTSCWNNSVPATVKMTEHKICKPETTTR